MPLRNTKIAHIARFGWGEPIHSALITLLQAQIPNGRGLPRLLLTAVLRPREHVGLVVG